MTRFDRSAHVSSPEAYHRGLTELRIAVSTIAESDTGSSAGNAPLTRLPHLTGYEQTLGTADELERRRKQAVQAVTDGQPRATVARVLGVHYKTVARWVRAARKPDGVEDDKAQDLRIHLRGSHLTLGAQVPRRFPVIVAGDKQAPITKGSGRLELADWFASPTNSLTARVMAIRFTPAPPLSRRPSRPPAWTTDPQVVPPFSRGPSFRRSVPVFSS